MNSIFRMCRRGTAVLKPVKDKVDVYKYIEI